MSSLAAARADNFYYPKDFDPSKHNTLAQHNRSKGITKGTGTVRFEMMFHVRCEGCKKAIGKGVRFNAQKKQVDVYLGTKIYEFEMTCHLCSHHLKVRTDPKSCDYLLTAGLTRIMPESYDSVAAPLNETRHAFEKLEGSLKDRQKGLLENPRLEALIQSKSDLKNDFMLNKMLRA